MMKKNIRLIGLILAIAIGLFLIGCKEKEVKTEVNLDSLPLGFYKYKSVYVPVAVDLNKDGIFNKDLIYEDENHVFDNLLSFTSSGSGQVWRLTTDGIFKNYYTPNKFDYVFDEENKTIQMTYKLDRGFNNVEIGKGKTISYEMWDQDIKQIVTYNLEYYDF